MSRRSYAVTGSRNPIIAAEDHNRRRDDGAEVAAAVGSSQNAIDRRDCADLIAHEMGSEETRRIATSYLGWLDANPAHCLARGLRLRLSSILRALDIRRICAARGEPAPERKPKRRRPPPWPRSARPAWMADPSLLPKRPPSSRGGE